MPHNNFSLLCNVEESQSPWWKNGNDEEIDGRSILIRMKKIKEFIKNAPFFLKNITEFDNLLKFFFIFQDKSIREKILKKY